MKSVIAVISLFLNFSLHAGQGANSLNTQSLPTSPLTINAHKPPALKILGKLRIDLMANDGGLTNMVTSAHQHNGELGIYFNRNFQNGRIVIGVRGADAEQAIEIRVLGPNGQRVDLDGKCTGTYANPPFCLAPVLLVEEGVQDGWILPQGKYQIRVTYADGTTAHSILKVILPGPFGNGF